MLPLDALVSLPVREMPIGRLIQPVGSAALYLIIRTEEGAALLPLNGDNAFRVGGATASIGDLALLLPIFLIEVDPSSAFQLDSFYEARGSLIVQGSEVFVGAVTRDFHRETVAVSLGDHEPIRAIDRGIGYRAWRLQLGRDHKPSITLFERRV